MRIALVTAHYQPATVTCGVGDYTRCLRQAFESLGHPCAIVTSARSRSQEPEVYRIPGRWGLRDTLAAGRILRSLRPDAVALQYTPGQYGYGPTFKLLPLHLRRAPSRPLVVTAFHTLVGGRWIAKPYAALLAATSHGVVSTHAELSDLFRRHLPWLKYKLREIPIGANIPRPSLDLASARLALRRRLGLGPDAVVLGTFGFPAPGKGFDTLLHALQRLNGGPPLHLVCIGETRQEDRGYRAELEALARRLGVEGRVHWLGGVPEQAAADLLWGTDAYVVPYDDGSSLRRGTLLAGFRVGVPLVTTTPRYADPSLRPGETIIAVPPRSPEALAGGIAALLADRDLQARLRERLASLGDRFDWRTIAAQHLSFLDELRERRGKDAMRAAGRGAGAPLAEGPPG